MFHTEKQPDGTSQTPQQQLLHAIPTIGSSTRGRPALSTVQTP
jgi:hypothetical protein